VTKLKGDTWLFTARIQYGKHDLTVPMPLEVQWAGDTPMITLTDFKILGHGPFGAARARLGYAYIIQTRGSDARLNAALEAVTASTEKRKRPLRGVGPAMLSPGGLHSYA
jgi:hypothetical protein